MAFALVAKALFRGSMCMCIQQAASNEAADNTPVMTIPHARQSVPKREFGEASTMHICARPYVS
jgi:hypothetical protein